MTHDKDAPSWHILWNTMSEDGLCGWVSTLEEAENVRKVFQVENIDKN